MICDWCGEHIRDEDGPWRLWTVDLPGRTLDVHFWCREHLLALKRWNLPPFCDTDFWAGVEATSSG